MYVYQSRRSCFNREMLLVMLWTESLCEYLEMGNIKLTDRVAFRSDNIYGAITIILFWYHPIDVNPNQVCAIQSANLLLDLFLLYKFDLLYR